jgi:predicted MFS family arabinose efflux permease
VAYLYLVRCRHASTMNQGTAENPSATAAHAGRHGCLTTYLVFVIIVNSGVFLTYLFGTEWLQRNGPKTPEWAFWLLAICGVTNVISAVALLRWKRWGFWLFVISTIAALGINFLIGLGPQAIFGAVLGIAILYAVLHIGGERKAWPRLQ